LVINHHQGAIETSKAGHRCLR